MASKVCKRAAAATGGAPKKARVAKNPVLSQCTEVAAALESATGLTDSVRKMLVASVAPALSLFKDLRHQHQITVVGWISKALAAQQSALEAAITDAKAKAESVTSEKGACEAAVAAAEENLVQLSEAAAAAQSKNSEANASVDAAAAALETAKDAQSGLDSETNAAVEKKESLEAILSAEGPYAKMKAEVSKKKDADAFIKMLKKKQFEQTLLQTLAPILVKEPASRTEFDNMVLQNVEENVTQQIAAQVKIIEDAGPGKQERAAATAAAESALEAARAAAAASDSVTKEAESAVKGGQTALKDAQKALKACGPAAKQAAASVTEAESALEDFCNGPLTTFKGMQDRIAPVEEPELAAEDPPAAEVPAADTPEA